MEIRIGITNSGRELTFDTNQSAAEVSQAVTSALESQAASVTFTDVRGNTYIIPAATLGYVEIGTEEARRVGFVA